MSRLRAYAFAWAFSEQFEIGLVSEASIGQIQRYCCAHGFVDHVITPNGGLVWMLAGDALDRYVTVPLEGKTHNTFLRVLTRSVLNPPQTFANAMMLEKPWRRENRGNVSDFDGQMYLRHSQSLMQAVSPGEGGSSFERVAKFELAGAIPSFVQFGNVSCLGGDGIGAFRAGDYWQWTWTVEVGGCTLSNSLSRNWTGDSLTFTTGPQWISHATGRWSPRLHFRVGGQKVTEEYEDPVKKEQIKAAGLELCDYRDAYIQH